MFKYDWCQFDAKLGLIFMAGVIVTFTLLERFEFSTLAAAVGALLAWLTVILVPGRTWAQHILGLIAYLVVGVAPTWLAAIMLPYEWGRLISMAIVTFAGYLMLLRGPHPYIVAWCLVYWYLLVPLFLANEELGSVILGHLIGSGLVIGLNLLKPLWSRATKQSAQEAETAVGNEQESPSAGFVLRYSVIVSLSILAGLAAGTRWLSTDPTLVANATLNMISPSLKQTWQAAVERVILGTAGIVTGFYFGWFFPEPWVGLLVVAVFSFFSLAVLFVNVGFFIAALFFLTAYSWGALRSDLGRLLANEKIIAEFVGVLIAVVAVAILVLIERNRTSSSGSS